jgi:hypothetical protein
MASPALKGIDSRMDDAAPMMPPSPSLTDAPPARQRKTSAFPPTGGERIDAETGGFDRQSALSFSPGAHRRQRKAIAIRSKRLAL